MKAGFLALVAMATLAACSPSKDQSSIMGVGSFNLDVTRVVKFVATGKKDCYKKVIAWQVTFQPAVEFCYSYNNQKLADCQDRSRVPFSSEKSTLSEAVNDVVVQANLSQGDYKP